MGHLGGWVATLDEPLAYKKGLETSSEVSESDANTPLTIFNAFHL